MISQENSDSSDPFSVFQSVNDAIVGILVPFNEICINIFRFGNWILFLIFIFLGVNLLMSAHEKETEERIHGKNLEYIQKRGRIGSFILILIAIGFLFKGLTILTIISFSSFSAPPVFRWLKCQYLYNNISTLEDLKKYDVFEVSLFLFISLVSFISIILISFGIYLLLFNKRILRTHYKACSFIVIGVILACIFGITPGLLLTL